MTDRQNENNKKVVKQVKPVKEKVPKIKNDVVFAIIRHADGTVERKEI